MQHPMTTRQTSTGRAFLPAAWAAAGTGLLGAAGIAIVSGSSTLGIILALAYALGVITVMSLIIPARSDARRTSLTLAAAASTAGLVLLGALSYGALLIPALLLWLVAGAIEWRATRLSPASVTLGMVWGFGATLLVTGIATLLVRAI